jgi:hypothetical protein
MEIEPVQDKVCYLTILPMEICNYIFEWLERANRDEFIAQTTKEKDEKFPEKYYTYFGCKDSVKIEHIIGVFSPDKCKIALFNNNNEGCLSPGLCTNCMAPTVVAVDIEAQTEDNKILFVATLDARFYRTIALSSSGNMYATIKKEIKNQDVGMPSHKDYEDVLVIYNRVKNKERTFKIPDGFYVSHLMFNKQGTSVIAHARDFRCDPAQAGYLENHMLFDIKTYDDKEKNDANKKVIVENKDEKNFLLDYFRNYTVCNKIMGIEK